MQAGVDQLPWLFCYNFTTSYLFETQNINLFGVWIHLDVKQNMAIGNIKKTDEPKPPQDCIQCRYGFSLPSRQETIGAGPWWPSGRWYVTKLIFMYILHVNILVYTMISYRHVLPTVQCQNGRILESKHRIFSNNFLVPRQLYIIFFRMFPSPDQYLKLFSHVGSVFNNVFS